MAAGVGVAVIALAVLSYFATRAQPVQVSTAPERSTPAPTPRPSPGWPAQCGASRFACIPGIDADDLATGLRARNFNCRKPNDKQFSLDCVQQRGPMADMEIKVQGPLVQPADPAAVFELEVYGSFGGRGGARPSHSQDAWNLNKQAADAAVSAAFAKYPAVRQQLKQWLAGQDGTCSKFATIEAHDTVDGYQARCTAATPISVGYSAADTVTTWEGQIAIQAPLVADA